MLFYGRDSTGEVDHRAWHKGDCLRGGEGTFKAICPMLKEVPMEHLVSPETFNVAVSGYVKHARETWIDAA